MSSFDNIFIAFVTISSKNQKLIIKGLGFIEFKMDSSVNLELIDGVEYLIN